MSKLVQIDDIISLAPNEHGLAGLAGRRPGLKQAIERPSGVNLKLNRSNRIFRAVKQWRENRKIDRLAVLRMEILEHHLPLPNRLGRE
jgi:hypothetical protein